MKVLLVVTKGDLGGAQKRVYDLAMQFQEKGDIDVTVGVGGYGDWLPAQLKQAGIKHRRFPNLSRSNPLKIIAWWFSFYDYLSQEDFDVVHLNSSSALSGSLPAKFVDGVKVVFTFRGLSIISPHYPAIQPLKWFYWLAFKLFLPFVDVGVFQCEHDKAVASGRGLAPKNSVVIRPGIDPKAVGYLERDKARAKLADKLDADFTDQQVVGTIGRLSAQKNYEFLIKAFAKLQERHNDLALVIIGDGPDRAELEQIASDFGVGFSVYFAGSIPGAARLMKAFDVFVLPSLYEGVSMTLTEAVHAGIPILASDVGGNRETVCGNEPSLFAKNSIATFTKKLDNMLAEESARKKAIAGEDCAETLRLSNSSQAYADLYKGISQP